MSPTSVLTNIGNFAHFAARALIALPAALARPQLVLKQVYAVLIGALPLGFVAGIALGAVVWMHTHAALARTGTADYLPTFLAAAVLIALGPIAAALIVAARTGSSLGAELGAMRIGEQIDALEMLGLTPMRMLVAPRVLACMLALPLLYVLIAALALFSGFGAESLAGSTTWLKYQTACLKELYPQDVVPAAMKTIVFGFLIGAAGCYRGLNAAGGADGVGHAATSAVVLSCLLVLAADVLLVGVIQIAFG